MTDLHHPDPTPTDWEALARYVAGESPESERVRIEARLAGSPEDAALVQALREVSGRLPRVAPSGLDVEGALRRTKERAREARVVPIPVGAVAWRSPFPVRGAAWRSPWLRAAAAAGVAVLGYFALDRRPAAEVAASDRVIRAGVGGADSVTLADGSLAVLAPGTELVIPGSFGDGDRVLRLTGRGWFRVQHVEGAPPFIVESRGAVVRDVGTVFSIEGREGRGMGVRVAVHEGSVAVRGRSQPAPSEVSLAAGDEATVTETAVASVTRGTVGQDDADWVSGLLHFRNVSMEELAASVGAWTGLTVRVDDPALRGERFDIDLSVAEARAGLQEAALAMGATLRWSGDTVVVSRGGRTP